MDFDKVVNYLSTLILAVVGIWNIITIQQRNKSLKNVDDVQNIKTLNESISLANSRALEAEKFYDKARDGFEIERNQYRKEREEMEEKLSLVVIRIKALEVELNEKYSLPYRIVFDVTLGTNPEIVGSEIKHIPERREKEVPVIVDRRKAM